MTSREAAHLTRLCICGAYFVDHEAGTAGACGNFREVTRQPTGTKRRRPNLIDIASKAVSVVVGTVLVVGIAIYVSLDRLLRGVSGR